MNDSTSTPADFPAFYDLQVRLADDDHFGHVNNARYYEYFDSAINGWLIEGTGVRVRDLPALGVVVSSSCNFVRELHFPNQLRVGIRLLRVGRSSVTYAPAIFRIDPDDSLTLCATGEFAHVYVDPASRRPVPIPAEVLTALDPLLSANVTEGLLS